MIVNRLWQHHFGVGLVCTAGDFGRQGETPTHPELLDWLAGQLVQGGWRLKPLHRLMVTSAAYLQSDVVSPEQLAVDPEGRWLSHRRPLRLEPEAPARALLVTSGTLNPKRGGPGVKGPIPPEANSSYNVKDPYPRNVPDNFETHRRSVYLFVKRSLRQPIFELFDAAEPRPPVHDAPSPLWRRRRWRC